MMELNKSGVYTVNVLTDIFRVSEGRKELLFGVSFGQKKKGYVLMMKIQRDTQKG
jgi:hypothetical protein